MADPKAPLPGGQVVIDDCKDDGLFHGRHRPPGDVTGEWWPVTEEAPIDNLVWARQNGVWVEVVGATPTDFGIGLSKDENATPPIVNLQVAGWYPQFLGGVYVPPVNESGLVIEPDGRLTAQASATDYGLGLSYDENAVPPLVNLTPAGTTQPLLGGVYVPTRDATQAADVDTSGGDGKLVVLTATDTLLGGILEPVKDGLPYERQWNETAQVWEWVQPTATGLDFGTGLSKDETQTPPIVHLQPAGDSPDTLGGVYVVDRVRNVEEGLELGIDGRLRAPLATPRLAGTIVEPEDDGKGYVRTTLNGVSAWVPPSDTVTDYGTGLVKDETTTPPIVHLQPALDYAIGGIMEPPQDGIAHSRQFDALNQVWIWVPALTAGLQITSIIPDKAIYGPTEPLLTVHAYGAEFTPTCVIHVDDNPAQTTYVSATELTFILNPAVPATESFHIITVHETSPTAVEGLGAEQFDFIKASTEVDYGTGLSLDTAPTPPMVHLQPAGDSPATLGGVYVIDRVRNNTEGLELGLDGRLRVPVATDSLLGGILEPPPDDKGYVRRRTVAGESAWVPPSDSGIIVQDEPPTQPVPPNSLWWDSNAGKLYLWYDDGTTVQWVQVDGGEPTTTDFGVGLALDETQTPKIVNLTPAGWDPTFLGGVYTTGGRSATEGLDLDAAGTGKLSVPLATPDLAGSIIEPIADDKGYVRRTDLNGVSQWVPPADTPLNPANTNGEIGGVIVVGRGPTQGLEYDIGTGTLWAPLATDILAGAITEPPPDDKQYARKRTLVGDSTWVEIDDSAGGINDVPRDPVGEEYVRAHNRWLPVQKGGQVQPRKVNIGGDTMTGLLILSGDPVDEYGAVPRHMLADLKLYVDAQDAADRVWAETEFTDKPPPGGPFWMLDGAWSNIPATQSPLTFRYGLMQTGDIVDITPATNGKPGVTPELGGVYATQRDDDNGLVIDDNGHISVPLATDLLAGSIVEPPPDDKQYARLRTAAGVSQWVETSATGVTISDTPPVAPAHGDLWWESDSGTMFIWYDDGTSAQWVQTDASPEMPSYGIGLELEGGAVNLKPANFNGEIGGVMLVGRGPTQGLEYDIATGTVWSPLATDVLAGSFLDAPKDGKPYARTHDDINGARWTPTSNGAVIINDDAPLPNPVPGTLWFQSDQGTLAIWYEDADSSQWVQVNGSQGGGDFLPLTGGTVTGPIVLPVAAPTLPEHATHKNYVDIAVANASLYQGTWAVAANTPNLITATPLNAYSWLAVTADAAIPEVADASIPGIGGASISSGDTIKYNAALAMYEQIKTASSAGGIGDAPSDGEEYVRKDATWVIGSGVLKTGDTMTGTLVAPSVEIKATAHAASTVRLFPSGSPNGGRIDFQKADGSARKGYIGYGSDTDLILHAEAGVKWRATGGFRVDGGSVIMTQTANGSGYNIGDPWHGMYFHGGNTLCFTEYHNRFEWRAQTSGVQPGGTVSMSLYGNNLSVAGTGTFGGTVTFQTGAILTETLAMQIGQNAGRSIGGGDGNGGVVYRTVDRHKMFVGVSQFMEINSGGTTMWGTITDSRSLAADLPGSQTADGGFNVIATLKLMAAKIKAMEAEITALKGAR